jgi:two-component system chemotaxis sensor kinase CheA
VSGRGVGMDVVRVGDPKLGGKVEVASQKGRGSTSGSSCRSRMVLTKVMVVTCGQERYGLALDTVVESHPGVGRPHRPVRAGRAFRAARQVVPLVAGRPGRGGAKGEGAAERVVVARVGASWSASRSTRSSTGWTRRCGR